MGNDLSLQTYPQNYVVVDIETTGLSPERNEIIEVSAIKVVNGNEAGEFSRLVEVPCIKRNPFLGIHAVTAYELASAGIKSVIPINEIIDAPEQTGQLM